MRPRRCLWCKGPTPLNKLTGKPRALCSVRCTQRIAEARYRGKPGVKRAVAPGRLFARDLAGHRFGRLVVLAPGTGHRLRVRCDCGAEETRARHSLLTGSYATRNAQCASCVVVRSTTSLASKAPGATRGKCSWCGGDAMSVTKPGGGPAYECEPCNRQAARRGREADGRPVYVLPPEKRKARES